MATIKQINYQRIIFLCESALKSNEKYEKKKDSNKKKTEDPHWRIRKLELKEVEKALMKELAILFESDKVIIVEKEVIKKPKKQKKEPKPKETPVKEPIIVRGVKIENSVINPKDSIIEYLKNKNGKAKV